MRKYIIGLMLMPLFVGNCWSAVVGPRISDDHNIDQCNETKMGTAVLQTNIYEAAAFLNRVERTIIVPETGILESSITCIRVLNEDTEAHGGYPKIASGGIGSKSVHILLKSQWAQPLNFRVEIYREEYVKPDI